MTIEHVALWTTDLEQSRHFYTTYFGATASNRYHNPTRRFTSYFLRFVSGARLELMHRPELLVAPTTQNELRAGYAHLAFATGDQAAVDHLTERLRAAGYTVLGEPRTTGDGYYESIVADPDGNPVEITV
ncbi:VOC family protein [Hymenobacter sp. YC55]|uniref:VOC family protein n=1 Tax=Hymenobacter sp. YC55 TaxID=3034019 RepID=UPI0023F93186|nr:VOC family protein [Hymenobacter sp. YC55]MDF7814032.1 VOC family protein [Hymenobacter sp. YC55]